MAGMVPAKRDNAVTDPTLAANVNKEFSYSARAVEARADAVAAPAVAGAISNDPTVISQVQQIVQDTVNAGTLTTANIALDTDGTPYYAPGDTTFFLGFDFDGTPYYTNGA